MAPRLAGWSGLPSTLVGRPEMTLDENTLGDTGYSDGGRVEQRPARHDVFRRVNVRHDQLGRLSRASG